MNVEQLITQLSGYPLNAEVFINVASESITEKIDEVAADANGAVTIYTAY